MAFTLVDEASALTSLLDSLDGLTHSPPSLFLDLKGENLSRHGTISILQLYVRPLDHVYLIDIYRIGTNTFNVAGSSGQTLKSFLESPIIPKVIFDVRRDSDALFSLFDVKLDNVDDLQLMELAARLSTKQRVNGLKRCIEHDGVMTYNDKQEWIKIKNKGQALFDPKNGDSYAVFDQRPLSRVIQSYCIQDVIHLPGLWTKYSGRLSSALWVVVRETSQARIKEAQSLHFNPNAQNMSLAPWLGWPTSKGPLPTSTTNVYNVIGNGRIPLTRIRSRPFLACRTLPDDISPGVESAGARDRNGKSAMTVSTSRVDHDLPLHLDIGKLRLANCRDSGS